MTLPDTERLLEADEDAPFPERDRALFELLYATGLRVSEAAGLDLEDVDFTSRLLRVIGKGNKERIAPFGETAGDALAAYLPERARRRKGNPATEREEGEPLFVNARGGRLTTRSMARLLKHRLLPPIATSSPRETRTARPRASAASARKTADALLFTAIASSAPNRSRAARRT